MRRDGRCNRQLSDHRRLPARPQIDCHPEPETDQRDPEKRENVESDRIAASPRRLPAKITLLHAPHIPHAGRVEPGRRAVRLEDAVMDEFVRVFSLTNWRRGRRA
jgi:hypothetical protein